MTDNAAGDGLGDASDEYPEHNQAAESMPAYPPGYLDWLHGERER